MDWQPIETAPKDGTIIMAYNGDGNENFYTEKGRIGVVRWERNGFSSDVHGWMATDCCDGVTQYTPTHWMPLPNPPVSST